MLPKVSYVTCIDYYIYVCWAFLLTTTVIHCAFPYSYFEKFEMSDITLPPDDFPGDREAAFIEDDMYICYVLAGIWTVVNIVFFSFLKIRATLEYRSFHENAILQQLHYDKQAIDTLDMKKTTLLENTQHKED